MSDKKLKELEERINTLEGTLVHFFANNYHIVGGRYACAQYIEKLNAYLEPAPPSAGVNTEAVSPSD